MYIILHYFLLFVVQGWNLDFNCARQILCHRDKCLHYYFSFIISVYDVCACVFMHVPQYTHGDQRTVLPEDKGINSFLLGWDLGIELGHQDFVTRVLWLGFCAGLYLIVFALVF